MEGIGLAQERRLRSRKRSDKTEEEKWAEVWAICFPEEYVVPSPYYDIPALAESNSSKDNGQPSELAQYEAFMRAQLPRRVRCELEQRIAQQLMPIEENLKAQLIDIVRDMQLRLLEEFKKPSTSRSTTDQISNVDASFEFNNDLSALSPDVAQSVRMESHNGSHQNKPVADLVFQDWDIFSAQHSSATISPQDSYVPVSETPLEAIPGTDAPPRPASGYQTNEVEPELMKWHNPEITCFQPPARDVLDCSWLVPGYCDLAINDGLMFPLELHDGSQTKDWSGGGGGGYFGTISLQANWDTFNDNGLKRGSGYQAAPSITTMTSHSTLACGLEGTEAEVELLRIME
ncbi:hypothetical protein BD289DRAFT_482075 [Coniella lustricola]|uniref:Uncharacterized protein n=1 Tax=Coniella lustricola TaxID=2025994 RepID=A0A2T3AAA0_9PEZI|nr:hypothetical protein BD289DRAFT_482075 [Coniella lustricola]